jgi:hypothetical protein
MAWLKTVGCECDECGPDPCTAGCPCGIYIETFIPAGTSGIWSEFFDTTDEFIFDHDVDVFQSNLGSVKAVSIFADGVLVHSGSYTGAALTVTITIPAGTTEIEIQVDTTGTSGSLEQAALFCSG